MPAPVRRQSPGSALPPIPHPAPAFGIAALESRDLPSVQSGHDAPAIPPSGPAHPAAIPRASTHDFRLHSGGDRGLWGARPWLALMLRVDAATSTPAGAVRYS